MTGDQSVIKSRVAKAQHPYFQATCPPRTRLQNTVTVFAVGFVFNDAFSRKETNKQKISFVLTGVDTPDKKERKEKGRKEKKKKREREKVLSTSQN